MICDFCVRYTPDGKCGFGLSVPQVMRCREFDPGIEQFCADPKDFVSARQIGEMASYFGIKGTELKKVNLLITRI